jgi:hypothetical protein
MKTRSDNGRYILDEKGEPVPCASLMEWAKWIEGGGSRRVAEDFVGDVRVSTVFLGLDHSFVDGPPVLWETMIFGGPHDEYQERYTSREAALAGHTAAVALARSAQN